MHLDCQLFDSVAVGGGSRRTGKRWVSRVNHDHGQTLSFYGESRSRSNSVCLVSEIVLATALDLSEKQPEFAAKGVKLVGVVHEKLGVEEFSGFFKNGEIYFDEEKAFFNGEIPYTAVVRV